MAAKPSPSADPARNVMSKADKNRREPMSGFNRIEGVLKFSLVLCRSWIILSVLVLFGPLASHADNSLQYFVKTAPFKSGVPAKYGIEAVHPYAFEVRPLQQAMASLAYQKQDFSWSGKKHVFQREGFAAIVTTATIKFSRRKRAVRMWTTP